MSKQTTRTKVCFLCLGADFRGPEKEPECDVLFFELSKHIVITAKLFSTIIPRKCLQMARPIPRDIERDIVSLTDGDLPPKKIKSLVDLTIDGIRNRSTKNLVFGTVTGWLAGVTVVRVGRIAAFGLGGGVLILHFATEGGYVNVNWDRVKEAAAQSQAWAERTISYVKTNSCFSVGFFGGFFFGIGLRPTATTPVAAEEPRQPLIPKPLEPFKPEEAFDKPAFPKPIPHSPKISPSSIPNPNPSVTTNKPAETGYPNYGGYLYSIPGYSAFQPVSYPSVVQPNPAPIRPEPPPQDFTPFPPPIAKDPEEEKPPDEAKDTPKQQDFEEQFTPEIIPAVSNTDVRSESKMNVTSLAQGSGATVSVPSQINKEAKKKQERFSLKTSIPISKIDMKCVASEASTQSVKKPVFNPAFQKEERPRVEIQSNIVIKSASKEAEGKDKPIVTTQSNSISTLINAAEAINKNDGQFRVPEPKVDVPMETKEPRAPSPPQPAVIPRPIFNPMTMDTTKSNFPNKPPEGGFNEQKNQIVFIQNKNNTNSKMMVTIQQQNPQVLLQRTNFESKNLQAPSRLSNQKKSKDEIVTDNGSSKVVSLKRLHQDDCDENDFENLITENQIYGNKIVVKEKSQGTQQEQDLKNKTKVDKQMQPESKNVVLQPNFVYLSNVQFPNLMMIKNNSNSKLSQTEPNKPITQNEVKTSEVSTVTSNNNTVNSMTDTQTIKNAKPSIPTKEIHVLKTSNNVLQALTNNNNKDIIFPNKKVIVHPQMIYKVVEDKNQNLKNQDTLKLLTQKKEPPKPIDTKNEKVFIACPYQKEIKLQPKIVIDLRPKMIAELEDISTLDVYEKRKRLRRLKYLSNVNKDSPKIEFKKDKIVNSKNIITPDKMKAEIFKEFTKTKGIEEVNSDSDSDYGENELTEYTSIIEEYGAKVDDQKEKMEFLAGFSLATHAAYKDKDVERQQRSLKFDSVASAYIAVGRLEHLTNDRTMDVDDPQTSKEEEMTAPVLNEDFITRRKKQQFLAQLRLTKVSPTFKEQYEQTWREILRERNRRNGITNFEEPTLPADQQIFDPNTQLLLLTQIKNSVNENNNLIKKRLDSGSEDTNSDIRVLAEKNFSELNRLSKMADRSVKLLSAQDTRKRDLNPGFDSENIKKCLRIENKDYPKLKIPSISKIISLKSTKEVSSISLVNSCQATSMDEPENSAGGVNEMSEEMSTIVQVERTKEASVQTEESQPWPGVDGFLRSYREYETARKAEISTLHRRNTSLRVECAHVTRAASRDSDRARALLAERHHLAIEETEIRTSLLKLTRAIEIVKNSF